jgi:hypothetical protein
MRRGLGSKGRVRGRGLRALLAHETGSATVFGVISFSMLIAAAGLVLDVGRVMNVHSQAASYADRVALASASELDRRPNALTRAITAAQGAKAQVQPGFRLSLSGDSSVGVAKLTFLSQLAQDPANPFTRSPIAGDVVTATWTPAGGLHYTGGFNPTTANAQTDFVLVDTTKETENYVFFPIAAAFVPDLKTSASVAPQALAGYQHRLCNSAPILVCNPSESSGAGTPFNLAINSNITVTIQGRQQQAGGGRRGRPRTVTINWGPNVYGLLDVTSTSTFNLEDYMSENNPGTACYADSSRIETNLSQNQRNAVQNGLTDRYNDGDAARTLSVAIVNCVANRTLMNQANRSIPIETYLDMKMRSRPNGDELDLRYTGPVHPQAALREYPVLYR